MVAERIRANLDMPPKPAQAIHDFILKIADNMVANGFAADSPLTAVAMETAAIPERINESCKISGDPFVSSSDSSICY